MEGFAPNNPDIYGAFSSILSLARELNISMQVPELVLVDAEGSAAAPLVSAILMHEFLPSDKLLRPFFVHVVQNSECAEARVTLRKESSGKHTKDEVVGASVAASAIKSRNVESSEPLHVVVEFDKCWNLTLILTPPIAAIAAAAKTEGDSSAEIAAAVAGSAVEELCKPAHRTLIFVEKAAEWDHCSGPSLGRALDPTGERSLFVYSQFNSLIQSFQGTRELNAYLTKAGPEGRFFFATFGTPDELSAQHKADMDLLEQLQYDLRYERTVGAPLIRRHVIEQTWRKYQSFVPEILKSLRVFKQKSDEDHRRINNQLLSMDSYKLRGVANTYVMDFLQSIEKLSVGTLEGNPAQNGQTLAEEKAAPGGAGDWLDEQTMRPLIGDALPAVAGHDSKLYGGQQFERLLAEFSALVKSMRMTPATVEEIATAAGPLRLALASNLAWAASDIARKAANRLFAPLVRQLFARARFIMERQVSIVDQMLESKRKAQQRKNRSAVGGLGGGSGPSGLSGSTGFGGSSSMGGMGMGSMGMSMGGPGTGFGGGLSGGSGSGGGGGADLPGVLSDVTEFPYFTNKVKEFYLDFVDDLAARCQSKCADEFNCTRMVYWEKTLDQSLLPSSKKRDDVDAIVKSVNAMAEQLFNNIKSTIATNIMLKCHSFFLVPVTERLWGELQGKITCLTDSDMEALFETKVTIEKLKREESDLSLVSKKFLEMEGTFQKDSDIFSKRPI